MFKVTSSNLESFSKTSAKFGTRSESTSNAFTVFSSSVDKSVSVFHTAVSIAFVVVVIPNMFAM